VVNNIRSYVNGLDLLVMVDNTGKSNAQLVADLLKLEWVEYICNDSNAGIASALNTGASRALENGCDFLLTMDQDSFFNGDDFQSYLKKLEVLDVATLGILSPSHDQDDKENAAALSIETDIVMTSGNLVNLEAYRKKGAFLEDLFIDHVDHEYCLRLRSGGYKIMIDSSTSLNHRLGELKHVKIMDSTVFRFISHSPERAYYMIRNGAYVAGKYKEVFPSFFRKNLVLSLKELVKIFFESDKIKRIRLYFLALKHARKGRLGKLVHD